MDFIVENALKAKNNNLEDVQIGQANIKIVGVGGAGNNMVGWLYNKGVKGAEIIAVNTDKQHLDSTNADAKFLIGKEVTRGLGCGGFPERGGVQGLPAICRRAPGQCPHRGRRGVGHAR